MSTITALRNPSPAGPTPLRHRAPAPDLARGAMLLLIALANTTVYLHGGPHSSAGFQPLDGSTLDRVMQLLLIIAVDLRVYPMFAILFGYGTWILLERQRRAGASLRAASGVLQRRHLWLIIFGAAHALLLWGGDVLGAYGLTGVLVTWLFLRRRDRTLLVWALTLAALIGILSLLTALGALGALAGQPVPVGAGIPEVAGADVAEVDPLAAAFARFTAWPLQILVLQGPLGLIVPAAILLGVLAARHRILEEPHHHRRLLTVLAILGVLIAWVGALPHALAHVGVIGGLQDVLWGFSPWQMLTGLAGGIGYVAVFGLLGARVGDRPAGLLRTAVTATGRRSMTSYLLQSVLSAPLLAAWGLGLGGVLHSTGAILFGLTVWLVTVSLALLLERRGARGPAESALRRLTYRRKTVGTGASLGAG